MPQYPGFPPKVADGRWYTHWNAGFIGLQGASVAAVRYAFPLMTGSQNISVDALGVWYAADGSPTTAQVRPAIYECVNYPSDLYPGDLLVDAGTITLTGGGGLASATFTPVTLSANTLYWFCNQRQRQGSANAGANIMVVRGCYPGNPYATTDSEAAAGNLFFRRQTPLVGTNDTSAWPSTFDSGFDTTTSVLSYPVIFFRVEGVS